MKKENGWRELRNTKEGNFWVSVCVGSPGVASVGCVTETFFIDVHCSTTDRIGSLKLQSPRAEINRSHRAVITDFEFQFLCFGSVVLG